MSEPLKMWELYPEFWKTESAFCSFLRGGIRRHLWSKNPVKLQFMNENRRKVVNTNPKSNKHRPYVWGFVCESCNKEFTGTHCEIDHKKGGHSLKKVEDIQSFVESIVFIRKEDLSVLCKPCHKAKTYSERFGISQELAVITKKVITMEKDKTILVFLKKNGIIPAKNAKARRQQCIDYLKGEL